MNEQLKNTLLEQILFETTKPYQYIGGEYLCENTEEASSVWDEKVSMALCFADKYEIGASNLGVRILYELINQVPEFLADRAYAPDLDFKKLLEENELELYAVETKKPLKEFDAVAFSLQYEMSYPTVLAMLKLANIPVKLENRVDSDPIVLAGGPCCFNPVPMAGFIDAFMIGDGEDVILEIMSAFQNGGSRVQKLERLARIEGVWVPHIHNCHQNSEIKVKKRVSQLNYDNHVKKYPVPYSASVHDRAIVEIRRGCGRMCRFCQAGHTNLPIRERKAEDVVKLAGELLQNTGYDEYSLLSLSSNDYANIKEVLKQLSCEFAGKNISASLPSQRVDRFDIELADLVQSVRKSTITLAPEAGSQRLRDVINKNLTKDQIIDTTLECYKNGYNALKFYFIVGLPTETYEDIDELADLLAEIQYRARFLKKELNLKDNLTLTCSLSVFVPKPFTPLQFCPQDSPKVVGEKIYYLKDKIKSIKGVKINYHDRYTSLMEAVLTRGDESLGDFIYALYEKGVYLASWGENFDFEFWNNTAKSLGIDLEGLAMQSFAPETPLPWEFIDIGVEKSWLIEQYKNAMSAKVLSPCEFGCCNCGVCKNLKVKKVLDMPVNAAVQGDNIHQIQGDDKRYRYRLKLTKSAELRYLSHLDWQNTIIKALYRSNLDLVFSQGYNPTPKVSLGIALPIFVSSECELIDIEIYNDVESKYLIDVISKVLPSGIKILSAQKIDKSALSIDNLAQWALYEFEILEKFNDEENKKLPNSKRLLYINNRFTSDDELFIKKKSKKGIEKLINVRPSIKSCDVVNGKLHIIMKVGQNNQRVTSEVGQHNNQGNQTPSIRPDDLMRLFCEDDKFNITRLKFFDTDLKEL